MSEPASDNNDKAAEQPLTPEQQAMVDEMMASPEAQELIFDLARAVVADVAPQELAVLDATVVVDRAERAMGGQGESATSNGSET